MAAPPLTVTGVPMSVVPTSNWTAPVADDGATVAGEGLLGPELLRARG